MRMGKLEKFFVNSRLRRARAVKQAERMLRVVKARPGMRYLDVGCGTGAAAIQVGSRCGLKAFGIDIDCEQVKTAAVHARSIPNLHFVVGEADKLPFCSESFDIVGCSMALHNIPQWETAIAETVRVATAGGFFVYRDFAAPKWVSALLERLSRGTRLPLPLNVHRLVEQRGLRRVFTATRFLHHEAVWQKG